MERHFLPDEIRLLSDLAAGDHAAFRVIYDRYWEKVFALACRKTGSAGDAEEMVQEIFTDLWMRRETLQVEKGLSNYLSTAVKYKVLDWLDKQIVRQKHLRQAKTQSTDIPSIPEYVRLQELRQTIATLTRSLPEKCRLVFQLSRDEGLNHQEIAERLQISPKTVESHLTRALRSFRTGLQQFFLFLF